jgi:ornithine carbamoyltransferase
MRNETPKRDFLSLLDFSSDELRYVIERGKTLRQQFERGEVEQPLIGKTGALILTMSSTRTRVAFEAGFAQMGAKRGFSQPGRYPNWPR